MKSRLFFALSALLLFPALHAQSRFDNILYGVAWYHEYMPSDRLDEDISLMKEAGISVVRVGESIWSLFEPGEGEFEVAWMDRIIDKRYTAGIKIILGTVSRTLVISLSGNDDLQPNRAYVEVTKTA